MTVGVEWLKSLTAARPNVATKPKPPTLSAKDADTVIIYRADEIERATLLRHSRRRKPLRAVDRLGQVRAITLTADGQYVVDYKQRFDTLKELRNFLKSAA